MPTSPALPSDDLSLAAPWKRFCAAVQAEDTVAMQTVLRDFNLLAESSKAQEVWATDMVRRWPKLAWDIAQETPKSEWPALWALAENADPSGWVATCLWSRTTASHRLSSATRLGLLGVMETVLTSESRVPQHGLNLALSTAMTAGQVPAVQLLLSRMATVDQAHAFDAAVGSEDMWALIHPRLSVRQWEAVGSILAMASAQKAEKFLPRLDQVIEALKGEPRWPQRLDTMLSLCESKNSPPIWNRLIQCAQPDMVLPKSVIAALDNGHRTHTRQLMMRANADRDALRKRMVAGAAPRWDLLDPLSAHLSPEMRRQWGRRFGARLPNLLAEEREHKALTAEPPIPLTQRPRQRP